MSNEDTMRRSGRLWPVGVADMQDHDQEGVRTSADEESSRSARLLPIYRVAAVLAGLLWLCGAVTAGAAALSGPRVERAVPGTVNTDAIIGAEALRPDLINRSGLADSPPVEHPDDLAHAGGPLYNHLPSPQSTPWPVAPVDQLPAQEPGPPAAEAAEPAPGDETAPESTALPHPPEADPYDGHDAAVDPVLDTVLRFYETVAEQPKEAFDLLSPRLQDPGREEFRQAWAGVRQATVEDIRQDGPDATLVTVRIEQHDGSVLRTLQRVLVIPGTEPRIADVVLLSASQS